MVLRIIYSMITVDKGEMHCFPLEIFFIKNSKE